MGAGDSAPGIAVARAFVLIDVLPNREKEVLEALAKMPFVVAKRPLKQRVGQADLIALIEGQDQAEVETFITSRMRMSWVHSVKRVMPHHTMLAWVQREMEDMAREVESRRPPSAP